MAKESEKDMPPVGFSRPPGVKWDYISASLHALYGTKRLRDYILRSGEEKMPEIPKDYEQKLPGAVHRLFRKMKSMETAINPEDDEDFVTLRQETLGFAKTDKKWMQQDPIEFILDLLAMLAQDISDIIDPGYEQKADLQQFNSEPSALKEWHIFLAVVADSFICKTFCSQLVLTHAFTDCKHKRNVREQHIALGFPVKDNGRKQKTSQCAKGLFGVLRGERQETIQCRMCDPPTERTIKSTKETIEWMPPILVIRLDKFPGLNEEPLDFTTKKKATVEVNHMLKFVGKNQSITYHLYAFIGHTPAPEEDDQKDQKNDSEKQGTFWCCTRFMNDWITFRDDNVTHTDSESLKTALEEAYILFYESYELKEAVQI